jgi:hypothetical protein
VVELSEHPAGGVDAETGPRRDLVRRQVLVDAAPGHVAHVRSLVVDVLSAEQLRRLGRDAARIMNRIDTSAAQ